MNEIEKMIIEHNETLKQHGEKLKKLENINVEIMKLAQSIESLASEMKQGREEYLSYQEKTNDEFKALKNDINAINMKPAQKWDNLISQILSLITAAIVGYLITKIGG